MKTKIKFSFLSSLILLLTPILWVGCVTPQPPGRITTTDYLRASTALVQQLLEKGILDKVANPPPKLRLLTIVDKTIEQIDGSIFDKKLEGALNESGKVTIESNPAMPVDYVLSSKVVSTYLRTSNIRTRTYTFQLTLSNPQGTAVWIGETEIVK